MTQDIASAHRLLQSLEGCPFFHVDTNQCFTLLL